MKNLIIVIATALFTITTYSQSGPKIQFSAPDNTIDYGKVSKNADNGIRTFEFKNTGDAPLQIINILSTKECSILSKPTSAIQPGQNGKIEVKYNMTPGPIRKTITVETNAVNQENGRVALKIKGEVI
ncbi:DUF1573 domain-containing protein [Flavobacterium succinicans]|jgi:Protein of unknown function (DUF1573)|uniref:DUF1573 domain-containing protein n=1 Tax=Flavobacterium succinicans TaxID=29536 RepID=A0A199XTZ8_9FLAO|nr:DUF1573 domain-containing protein [Flavobacterium succinicans]OAZ04902.1 hypothetical protein FLB_07500 [Flavobacterium succinicans]